MCGNPPAGAPMYPGTFFVQHGEAHPARIPMSHIATTIPGDTVVYYPPPRLLKLGAPPCSRVPNLVNPAKVNSADPGRGWGGINPHFSINALATCIYAGRDR